jgi:hypothetical protein
VSSASVLGSERMDGHSTEALSLGDTALAAHHKVLGRDHTWTKDSARVTADALDALGRMEEAKALRERYGLAEPENPKAPLRPHSVLARTLATARSGGSLVGGWGRTQTPAETKREEA